MRKEETESVLALAQAFGYRQDQCHAFTHGGANAWAVTIERWHLRHERFYDKNEALLALCWDIAYTRGGCRQPPSRIGPGCSCPLSPAPVAGAEVRHMSRAINDVLADVHEMHAQAERALGAGQRQAKVQAARRGKLVTWTAMPWCGPTAETGMTSIAVRAAGSVTSAPCPFGTGG